MKHFTFLLIAGFSLLLGACQNSSTETNAESGASEAGAGNSEPNIVVSNVKPSREKDPLNVQVSTDLLAAYALERTIKPAYDEAMDIMMAIRNQTDMSKESELERIRPMLESAQKVRNSYEEHQRYSMQLDSLTFKIAGNKLSIEEAQKLYLENRNALRAIESRLTGELEQLKTIKASVGAKGPGNQ
ncbi:MAG: hypothetical protein JNN28_16685 [Saprospiraceae bacterium]|nr:hypothetical protein [Saprospiraceae bacterium]